MATIMSKIGTAPIQWWCLYMNYSSWVHQVFNKKIVKKRHNLHHNSGVARPSRLGGHTYRWVSAARLGKDKKKRSQLSKQKMPVCSENIVLQNYPLFVSYTVLSNRERAPPFFKVGWAHAHPGPPLATPLHHNKRLQVWPPKRQRKTTRALSLLKIYTAE